MVRHTTTDDESAWNHTGDVYSDEYIDTVETCGLGDPNHRIAGDFVDVLATFEAFWSDGDVSVDVLAGGCNSCTTHAIDADVFAYIVTQNGPHTDSIYVGFGATDDTAVGAKLVGHALVRAANEVGVDVSWNESTNSKICLGDADAYGDTDDE